MWLSQKKKKKKQGSLSLNGRDLCNINLQTQGVWDAIENGDVEERKDRIALVAIYQAVSEDFLLMLAENDLANAALERLQIMHVGVECVKEAKVQTLKSEFKHEHQ